ncbi:MAG: hypothetical protein KGI55_11125 [Gammaproteobacteria bacterium]|nr:hypothetical protein [Gammaproteobacteria bacterium]
MRPLTVLIGILLGTSVSITFSLAVVSLISGLLSGSHPELSADIPSLVTLLLMSIFLTAAAAGSFVGELRRRSWRLQAHAATAAVLGVMIFWYWV